MPERIPLALGPLGGNDLRVSIAAIRWLCQDGEPCRPNQVIAYCNAMVIGKDRDAESVDVFHSEQKDLQIAFISRCAGRVSHNHGLSRVGSHEWVFAASTPDTAIGWIEPVADTPEDAREAPLDLHFMTGRRATDLAEDRSGMITGWHDRSRAWRLGNGGPAGSVLALGTCELVGVMRGEHGAFLEFLAAVPGHAQAIHVPDSPLVHSARVIIEQINRTPDEKRKLATDFARVMTDNPEVTTPDDWMFAAMSVQALRRSPTEDRYDLVSRTGVETCEPADAIILSIGAESQIRLQHRTDGYIFDCHKYRLARLGPAMKDWFQRNFDWIGYSIDEIRRDYLDMARLLRRNNPNRQILVLNSMSTMGREDILSYDAYDAPLGRQLQGVRARELNAMLHDIAGEANLAIIDSDAIGAELGGSRAIPDAVHQNAEMQAAQRAEILSALRARSVPGFF